MTIRKQRKNRSEPETEERAKQGKGPDQGLFEKASRFFRQNTRILLFGLVFLAILIPVFLSIQYRSFVYSLPVADGWAQNTINQNIRSQVTASIRNDFPNLPVANLEKMVDEQVDRFVADNKEIIEQQEKQLAAYFRSRLREPDGHSYLPDLDPYHYAKRIDLTLANGFPGHERREGLYWNKQAVAPLGILSGQDMFTWLNVQFYKVARIFFELEPRHVLFWFNLVFASLSTVLAFLITRHKGLFASFIAAFLVAVHPGSISRTSAGVGDTEIFALFFPLLAAWFLVEALETEEGDWKRLVLMLIFSGLSFGLLALAWEWWFFFVVFMVALLSFVVFRIVSHFVRGGTFTGLFSSTKMRWVAAIPVGIFLSTGFFVSLFRGFDAFASVFQAIIGRVQLKVAIQAGGIWPNVMTTVAELNVPSISEIINNAGGKLLFVLAVLGLGFAMVPKDRLRVNDWILLGSSLLAGIILVSHFAADFSILNFLIILGLPVVLGCFLLLKEGDKDVDLAYALFLAAWLGVSIFSMTRGVRFISLLLPPFILAVALGLNGTYVHLKRLFSEHLPTVIVVPVLLILLMVPLYPVAAQGRAVGFQATPHMSDAWWDSLTLIKEQSAPDAIITSWWDFGHWFRYVADRGVTFDGASQRGQLAHFIGRSLQTSDEKETLAILRMVDCGSDRGGEELESFLPSQDQYEAILLMKRLILLTRADAEKLLLANGLTDEQAAIVLNYTHCAPPEAYFITSGDMVGKAGVWGHFGSWNFTRADAYANFHRLPQATAVAGMSAKYGLSEDDASVLYYDMLRLPTEPQVNSWISPWPGYATGVVGCNDENGTRLLCGFNLQLNSQAAGRSVLEGLVVNISDPGASFFVVTTYDAQGRRVQSTTEVRPERLLLIRNGTLGEVRFPDGGFGMAVVVDLDGKRAIMADPLLAGSLFTRLFFFDGAGTVAFEKFSDQTTFTGSRIIVWKVDWSKLEELGLA